ncbi:MAG: glycosyltransferase family 4 protein [Lachnospiraceae bacterium]|jgi:glycosyltransferase involved in cell wall biosynthesis|nr:glycosyltransferase family 4 protein [Lachnospiraceae bacterium]
MANNKNQLPRVVMIGPARNVMGGVSTAVNNYYLAGLDQRVNLTYIATMVDGSKFCKLLKAIGAYVRFLTYLLRMDILHAHMSPGASYYRKKIFVDTASVFCKKVIIHFRGGDFQTFFQDKSSNAKKKIVATFAKADYFIVLSPEWKEVFVPLIGEEKLIVLGNAVSIPEKYKDSYSDHNILFVGRLCINKGVGDLLAVIPMLKRKFPDIHLFLAGVWEDEELRQTATDLKEEVTFLGWLDRHTLAQYMEKCSIFVLPTYYEGQPNALLEAMAMGMTAIATAVGGIPQLIEDGKTGRLITPRDVDSLSRGLKELLADEKLRSQLGTAARERVKERHGINQLANELYRIYKLCHAKAVYPNSDRGNE